MLLVTARATAQGERAAAVHYRRMAALAVFGLGHFFFIWSGDILFLYAVAGSLAFAARGWDARRLVRRALALYGAANLLLLLVYGAMLLVELVGRSPGAPPEVAAAYARTIADPAFAPDGARLLAVYRGDYGGILAHRLGEWDTPLWMAALTIGETLPLMWLGMALFKTGFLSGALPGVDYRRWAWRLLPGGFALTLAAGLAVRAMDHGVVAALNAAYVWTMIPRLMLTVGYAALLLLAVRALAGTPLLARIAAAGRAAFSNYLGASIVMTFIFYGYGLGLYGSVSRAALWLFVAAGAAAMLLWSKPWLDRFRHGPFEWLWRSLARGAAQPLRR